jgi:hypothetical protein
MNSSVIQIPIFDWTVNVMYNLDPKDVDECSQNLLENGAPADLILDLSRNVTAGGSSTVTGPNNQIYMIFPKFHSLSSMFKVISHEIAHAVTNICEHQGIHDSETFSYIMGFISSAFYEIGIISKMIVVDDNTRNEALMLIPIKESDKVIVTSNDALIGDVRVTASKVSIDND